MANQESALLLKTGAIVSLPPPGTVSIFSDASGNIFKIDSTGTVSSVGGGLSSAPNNTMVGNASGGAAIPINLMPAQILTLLGVTPYNDVRSAALIEAQALCGATLNVLSGTEFDRIGDFILNTSAGGTAPLSTTHRSGVVLVKSNGTANGQAIVSLAGTPTPGALIDNCKTSRFYCQWYAKLATAVDAASQLDFSLVAADGGNSLISVGQAGGIGTTNFRVRIVDGSGATVTNAAVAQAIDTNWHKFAVYNDATNLYVAIDAAVQYQTALTALVSGGPVYPRIFVNCGASATNREIDCDRMLVATASN